MKYLIYILFLFIGCEKPEVPECKDCTYIEMGQEYTVFVCGEELAKFERDGYPCIKPNCKILTK